CASAPVRSRSRTSTRQPRPGRRTPQTLPHPRRCAIRGEVARTSKPRRYNRPPSRCPSVMNPLLSRLQPYPFERLRAVNAGVAPNPAPRAINLPMGGPRHPTPQLLVDALARGATEGLANYPMTAGSPALREAIAAWLTRRHGLPALDPATQVLPVL